MRRFKRELIRRGIWQINRSEMFGDATIRKDLPNVFLSYDRRIGMYYCRIGRDMMPEYMSRSEFERRYPNV